MDKVKEQATVLARDGKAKLDQVQALRRADDMLLNLGALVYADRTGRGSADNHAKVDKLIADLKAHEAETGVGLSPEQANRSGTTASSTTASSATASSATAGSATAGSGHATDQKFPPESSTETTTQV
jgi:hypothetical protein